MIHLIKKWLKKPSLPQDIYPASQHGFATKHIDRNALKVLQTLDKSGCEAYLVGGVIRDGLLGLSSKDCDVVTNAKPKKIMSVIRKSIIVGKRFRIVHARFGRDFVEVSTFRAQPSNRSRSISNQGIIRRDNVYGTIDEDVMRRDFTVNALYYRFRDQKILDFVGGMDDLKNRRLRSIGDPMLRFKEDPVRMLRAVRFAAKLNLSIDENIVAAIKAHKHLLKEISGQRLFAEVLKLFYSGHAMEVHRLLKDLELYDILFPEIMHDRIKDSSLQLVGTMCTNADARYKEGRKLSVVYLIACMYWPAYHSKLARKRMRHFSSSLASELFSKIGLEIPVRVKEDAMDIWKNQYMFRMKEKAPGVLMKSKRLRASYELLCQRAMVEEQVSHIALYWADHVNI